MSSLVYQWKLYCITESALVQGFSSTAPTTCYNNPAHTINVDSISQIDTPTYDTFPINQQVNSNVFSPLCDINFQGTSLKGTVYSIQILIFGLSTTTNVRVVDTTNGSNVIANVSTSTTDTPTLYTMTLTPANITANPAVWEVQASDPNIQGAFVQSLIITYFTPN